MSDVLASILAGEFSGGGNSSINVERTYSGYKGETVAAGEVVKLMQDGTISANWNYVYTKGVPQSLGFTLGSSYIDLGSNKYLVANSGGGSCVLRVMDLSGNTPVFGTPVTAQTATNTWQMIKLTSTTAIVYTLSVASSPYVFYAIGVQISGTTVTVGIPYIIENANNTTFGYYANVCAIGTTKAMFICNASSDSYAKAQVHSLSGTNITGGTKTVVRAVADATVIHAIASTGTDKGIIVSKPGGGSNVMIAFTVSGTTITLGTPMTPVTPSGSGNGLFGVISQATDKFVLLYGQGTGTGLCYAETYNISGTTITQQITGAGVTFYSTQGQQYQLIYTGSTASYYAANIPSTGFYVLKVPNDGTLPSQMFNYGLSSNVSMRMIGTKAFLFTTATNALYVAAGTWTPETTTFAWDIVAQASNLNISPNTSYTITLPLPNGTFGFLGSTFTALDTADLTATVAGTKQSAIIGVKQLSGKVILKGIADGFTGLTPGQKYYIDTVTGSLDLTTSSTINSSNTQVLGLALSTTEIMIKDYLPYL